MIWLIFYLISLSILVLAVIIAIASGLGKYKIGRVVTPFNIMFGGVFLSTFMLIIPIQDSLVQDSLYKSLQVTLFSIFNTIQIFVIEGETSLIDVSRNCPYDWVASAYNVNLSIYYVVAPIMSFVFLISFFKNVKSFFKYINNYFNDVYIFSELSEKALALGSLSLLSVRSQSRLSASQEIFLLLILRLITGNRLSISSLSMRMRR